MLYSFIFVVLWELVQLECLDHLRRMLCPVFDLVADSRRWARSCFSVSSVKVSSFCTGCWWTFACSGRSVSSSCLIFHLIFQVAPFDFEEMEFMKFQDSTYLPYPNWRTLYYLHFNVSAHSCWTEYWDLLTWLTPVNLAEMHYAYIASEKKLKLKIKWNFDLHWEYSSCST